MNKTLNLQYHGIFCVICRHIKVFMRSFHGKCVCPVIWWPTGKEKPSGFLETVILCEAFWGNFKRKIGSSLYYHTISVCACSCVWICLIFRISVRLFSILLFLCNGIFSFSFKHSEHLLLLVLYAWCLPKISRYVCTAFIVFYFPKLVR